MIRWFIGLWDRREAPTSLALVRILLSVVVLYDLLLVGWYGLPGWFWADADFGGLFDLDTRNYTPPFMYVTDITPAVGWALWGVLVVSLALFGGGVATRFSGLVFLLAYAQSAWINAISDRGIDRMIRIVVLLLVFSRCGEAFSFDAWRRTGRWRGDFAPIPSWPRYLIILQLLIMYWFAGVAKFAVDWFPWGDYAALYVILQDPVFTSVDFGFLGHPALFWTTQVGTGVSHLWEWTFPLILLAYHFRDTRNRPGRLRAIFNRYDVRLGYVLIGIIFHVLLSATLRLGIFPWAMLAFYPVFFHPDEIHATWRRLRRRAGPSAPAPSTPASPALS